MLDFVKESSVVFVHFTGHGMAKYDALPDIERGYKELRPLFFGALGKLARQGFVTPPADGLDLIHDFFADEWTNLQRTYDPSKGSYKAYAYQAFVQFVRPRIVKMQRLQNYKLRPDEVDNLLREAATAATAESSHDYEVVRSKIAQLPDLQREILTSYVYSNKVSERALARTYSISRYRLRELLVDALGRVLVQLDRPAGISHDDWQVALALWGDARPVTDTAKYLGITQNQVRVANKRNFEFLTKVLSTYHPHRSLRSQEMKGHKGLLKPPALFKEVILSPNNENLLQILKQRAAEIVDSLNKPEEVDVSEEELQNLDPLWVAKVYEALATVGADPQSTEPFADFDLDYAHKGAEFEIGQAYKLSLIPGLPERLDLPHRWLVNVPEVDPDEMNDVLNSPSARGAAPYSSDLARYGVAPLTVLDATDAVARLLERCIRTGRVNGERPIRLSQEGVNQGELLNASQLADEVSRTADVRPRTARVLLDWSMEVAQVKPLLFNGFMAETSGEKAVALFRIGEKYNDLHQRWGRTADWSTRQTTWGSRRDPDSAAAETPLRVKS